jgi:ADP-ribose pyrophosphatase
MPPDELSAPAASPDVEDIEVVEDFTSRARCDEGFLHVRRLRCRNRRSDGSHSAVYRVDVVDRPRLDAVAVLVYRHGGAGLEVLTRTNLRPAAYFRKGRATTVPDARTFLGVDESMAGLLEVTDQGEEGVRRRAAAEVLEEAGYAVRPEDVELLGAPFFVVPGILSEQIFPTCVDVTDRPWAPPGGDGSPLEEGGRLRWWPAGALLDACRRGEVMDAKTELALVRMLARRGDAP